MSDSQYDTEFWFDAAGYTVLDWKANFTSDAEARKAFDAWLNRVRAEAWDECATQARELDLVDGSGRNWLYDRNPYREVGE